MVLLHVLIACLSLTIGIIVFFRPSRQGLGISYGLIAATIASGTYLALSKPAHMLETCLMGLVYTLAISLATVATQHRLVRVAISKSQK
jgi:hypothetical protein